MEDWFSIYDWSTPPPNGAWTFPRLMTEHDAFGELFARASRKLWRAPDPVLARYRAGVGWEYRPTFTAPYVALNDRRMR